MLKFFFCIFVGLLIYALPVPAGLTHQAWQLFSIFFATTLGIIIRPFPMGQVALIGLCATILTRTLDIQTQALTGFSSSIIWLVIMVFFIAKGVVKTNLGLRIGYYFISLFGRKTLFLGYAIAFTETFISPFIPSSTARAGGIMLPIINSISKALDSTPEKGTEKKLGSFLSQVGFHTNVLTGSLFLTGSSVNSVAQTFAAQQNITLTWTSWAMAALVPGLVCLVLMPLVIYWLNPPQMKVLTNATQIAHKKLTELGTISKEEKTLMLIFGLMLVLWIGEPFFKINATTVAFVGVSLCLLTNILTIDEIMGEKEAWNTFIWISTLVTMSVYLQKFGFIDWMAGHITLIVSGFSPLASLFFLSSFVFLSSLLFRRKHHANQRSLSCFSSCLLNGWSSTSYFSFAFGFFQHTLFLPHTLWKRFFPHLLCLWLHASISMVDNWFCHKFTLHWRLLHGWTSMVEDARPSLKSLVQSQLSICFIGDDLHIFTGSP